MHLTISHAYNFRHQIQTVMLYNINVCVDLFCRTSPSFNKEVFVDFIAAQIKTLSFLAYIIRIYQVRSMWRDSCLVHVFTLHGGKVEKIDLHLAENLMISCGWSREIILIVRIGSLCGWYHNGLCFLIVWPSPW